MRVFRRLRCFWMGHRYVLVEPGLRFGMPYFWCPCGARSTDDEEWTRPRAQTVIRMADRA